MESEARNQINNDYTNFFYATMCHVCKRFGDGVSLKRCSNCKMISYCGKEHQKQHWKQHKPFCKAIQDMPRDYRMDYRGETTMEWAEKKMSFAELVSYRLGRRLHVDEKEMIYFPKECLVCHEWKSLESCQKCAASFCRIHKNSPDHWDICAPLQLCLGIDLIKIREIPENELPDVVLKNIVCTSGFQSMRDFIKDNWNIQTDSEVLYTVEAEKLALHSTYSLTLFHAMRLLNYVPKSNDLVVHVIGADVIEIALVWTWEVFLVLMETLTSVEISVKIVIIGPGLKDKFDPSRTDDFLGNNIFSEYHDVSYEKYVRSSSFIKPNVIVGFSVGIDEEDEDLDNKEISAPSIHAIAKQNCPFVLGFTLLQCFQNGINKINTILGKEVDYLYSGKNPFACCKPIRGFGCVNYINQYVVIYQSLCS
ncbi:uncharacterized protein LOC112454841 isoform X1 [Temnothorax curvispinosus]|uniref:Uncharacterized protein LOC112454841 isoform X1 n=1 Tax=Temnothorax curvispinosus TaxID=300111 RepID=A0A6J1PQZ9_9HYME|nr:uncharacterized protein LOC112454841 isoform X1 [Temnothorax curvispinosus]XP_024872213.1 uncharacterized protein LOC112454841 isoform X1 [Temnothorax curvispinosus]XP_024872214.1 uncharacterized protein LOC112454841 isoform X1 [Temnothorax curvispinosus]XP_024872216.1 uncharacterized protein LOC112454841 isoform X1 [Temnothorax curvispinosus]XP_024872217.1 uncharacterized protein LOC112454841 isoform X1 [Temnothorax curvispinosus]